MKLPLNVKDRLDHWTPHVLDLGRGLLDQVRVKRVGTLRGMNVWIVNGEILRGRVDVDFTTGGNPARYSYVPNEDMWVEQDAKPSDSMPSLMHEFVEYTVMRKAGISNGNAHDIANVFEAQLRAALLDGELQITDYAGGIALVSSLLDRVLAP